MLKQTSSLCLHRFVCAARTVSQVQILFRWTFSVLHIKRCLLILSSRKKKIKRKFLKFWRPIWTANKKNLQKDGVFRFCFDVHLIFTAMRMIIWCLAIYSLDVAITLWYWIFEKLFVQPILVCKQNCWILYCLEFDDKLYHGTCCFLF